MPLRRRRARGLVAPSENTLGTSRAPNSKPVVRPAGLPVRRNRIRRATGLLTPVRAGAAFVMVLVTLGIYGVGASTAFTYRQLDFDAGPSAYTTRDAVVQALGLDSASPNLFLVKTDRFEQRLLEMPAVTSADVSVSLPDVLRVRIVERQPVVIWNVGGHRFLVDRTGLVFAPATAGGPGEGLPAVTDRRASSSAVDVGAQVDPVDLDAATRLAGVTPADIGSTASELRVSIEDGDGYVIRPVGVPWVARFGVYTQSLRTTDMIPGQVRLLRSLLAGRELTVKLVTLADERNGTYVDR
jgi:cell division septal protein FtsQ